MAASGLATTVAKVVLAKLNLVVWFEEPLSDGIAEQAAHGSSERSAKNRRENPPNFGGFTKA